MSTNRCSDEDKVPGLGNFLCLSVSGLQEACAVWPAMGNETIDHYDVKCNEVQPCDGYDVIKLEVTSLVRVGISCNG